MNYQIHKPGFPLSEHVDWFWFYDAYHPDHGKERVLPHGGMELVIDLACACGYHDQAHFILDFQTFSGLNPCGYLTHRGEYLNYLPIR